MQDNAFARTGSGSDLSSLMGELRQTLADLGKEANSTASKLLLERASRQLYSLEDRSNGSPAVEREELKRDCSPSGSARNCCKS